MTDWEVELGEGSKAGTRVVPVTTAGCYVPGGLYGYTASAAMTAATARAAGTAKDLINIWLLTTPLPHQFLRLHL